MFERFTESSRRCIFYARYEAIQTQSLWVEPEHLLLGFLREDLLSRKNILNKFLPAGQTPEMVGKQVLDLFQYKETFQENRGLPLSSDVKKVLVIMFEHADNLGQTAVDLEWYLFGILKHGQSSAAQILLECGVTLQAVENFISTPR